MKNLFLSLIFLVCGCGQSANEKEAELLKKERELLQKERELLEKEKNLNNAISVSPKANKRKKPQIQENAEPTIEPFAADIVYPNENDIKKDLLNHSVKHKKSTWTFAALSEYRDVRIIKQSNEGDYWEATVDMELEDYKNGRNYYMRLFVSYKFVDGTWFLQRFDPIDYYAR